MVKNYIIETHKHFSSLQDLSLPSITRNLEELKYKTYSISYSFKRFVTVLSLTSKQMNNNEIKLLLMVTGRKLKENQLNS